MVFNMMMLVKFELNFCLPYVTDVYKVYDPQILYIITCMPIELRRACSIFKLQFLDSPIKRESNKSDTPNLIWPYILRL